MCKLRRIVQQLLRLVALSLSGNKKKHMCCHNKYRLSLSMHTTNSIKFKHRTRQQKQQLCSCRLLSLYHQLQASQTQNSHPKDSSMFCLWNQNNLSYYCNCKLNSKVNRPKYKDQAQECNSLRHKLVSRTCMFKFLYLCTFLKDYPYSNQDKKMIPVMQSIVIGRHLKSLRMLLELFTCQFFPRQYRQ